MVTIIKHFAVNLKPNSLLTPNFKTKYSLSVPVGLVTLVVPDSKGSSIVLGFLNLTLRLRTMLGLDVILYGVRKQRGEITKLGRESVNTGKGKRKKHPSFGVHTVIWTCTPKERCFFPFPLPVFTPRKHSLSPIFSSILSVSFLLHTK